MAFQKNYSSSSSSSSSSTSFRWRFDIFVSYTGLDAKDLKNHLINYLKKKGLTIFKDDEAERGQSLNPLLDSAIEGSRASIVLFSENYAKSEWCLNELVKIMECKDMYCQLVFPIFYKVEPSVVRKQRGKYHVAMADYENKFKDQLGKVMNWRKALSTAASITGWEIHSNEAQLIDEIAEKVSKKIANQAYLYVAENPVGLQPRVSELNSILDVGNDKIDFKIVVVYGPQGIGKSTIAKAAYNNNAHLFQGSSFLADVSENSKQKHGVLRMQKTLLSEIQNDQAHMAVGNVDKGITLIMKRIGSIKVLLVYDDVNSIDDLQGLPHKADWFGKGSRIIVTTRDQNKLKFDDSILISTCEVKKLDDQEALELFCLNAFGNKTVRDGFVELAKRAVEYADGFPLKLIKWGSSLRGISKDEWDKKLEDYRRNNNQVQKVNLNTDRVFQQKEFRGRENVIISQNENPEKICRLLSARELSIAWSENSEYWSWISLPHSRFSEVAKLIRVSYFNIMGKIGTEELSSETTYAVYFVFKFEGRRYGFREREVNLVVSCPGIEGGGEQSAFLDPPKTAHTLCQKREDGWMEIKMSEFLITDGDYSDINCSLKEHDAHIIKTGLIVGGIEFRPKSVHEA